MLCPKCDRNSLIPQPTRDPDAQIDRCRQCDGLWFAKGSLTSAMAVAAKDLKVLDDAMPTDLLCPTCNKSMFRFKYPQTLVTIDMCGCCDGIWLDKGELGEIQTVRSHLQSIGELEAHAPAIGLKGTLLRFIDAAIKSMTGG